MKRRTPIITTFFLLCFFTSTGWASEPTVTEETDSPDTVAESDATEVDAAVESDTEVSVSEETEEEEASGSLIEPFSVSFTIADGFSMGEIFRDEYTVTNYNYLWFGLTGSYATPVDGLSTSLSLSLTKFTSDAGGMNYQHEARFGDIGLSGSWGGFFVDEEYTGLVFSGSLGLVIPTSDASRFSGLITRITPGLSISRSFGDLSLSYSFSFRKYFHEYTSVVTDLSDYELDILARDGGRENVGEALVALDTGVLPGYGFSNSFAISYGWFTGFSTSLSFSLSDTFTYDNGTITADDQYTNENAVVGRGHSQTMAGDISVSYSFLDYFSASMSMTTVQLPLTADNQSVRFPFFDLETGNLGNTEIRFALSAYY